MVIKRFYKTHDFSRFQSIRDYEQYLAKISSQSVPDLSKMKKAVASLQSKDIPLSNFCLRQFLLTYAKLDMSSSLESIFSSLREQHGDDQFCFTVMLKFYGRKKDSVKFKELNEELLSRGYDLSPLYYTAIGTFYGSTENFKEVKEILDNMNDVMSKGKFISSVINAALSHKLKNFAFKWAEYCLDNNINLGNNVVNKLIYLPNNTSSIKEIQRKLSNSYPDLNQSIDQKIISYTKAYYFDEATTLALDTISKNPKSMTFLSVNTVLSHLIKKRNFTIAREFVKNAIKNEIFSIDTYHLYLKLCTEIGDHEEFNNTISELESKFVPTELTYSRKFEWIQKIEPSNTLNYLSELHSTGKCVSTRIYNSGLKFFSKEDNIDCINNIRTMMKDRGLSLDTFSKEYLLYIYAKHQMKDEFCSVTSDPSKISISEFCMMLNGYVDSGNYGDATVLLNKLIDENTPDTNIICSKIRYLIKHPENNSDSTVLTNNVEEAFKLFGILTRNRKLKPKFEAFDYLIDGFVQTNNPRINIIIKELGNRGLNNIELYEVYNLFEKLILSYHNTHYKLLEEAMKKNEIFISTFWCEKLLERLINVSPEAGLAFIEMCNNNNISLEQFSQNIIEWRNGYKK